MLCTTSPLQTPLAIVSGVVAVVVYKFTLAGLTQAWQRPACSFTACGLCTLARRITSWAGISDPWLGCAWQLLGTNAASLWASSTNPLTVPLVIAIRQQIETSRWLSTKGKARVVCICAAMGATSRWAILLDSTAVHGMLAIRR